MRAVARRRRRCRPCGSGQSTPKRRRCAWLNPNLTHAPHVASHTLNFRTHTRNPGGRSGREGDKADGRGSGGVVVMNRSALVDEIVLRPPQVVETATTYETRNNATATRSQALYIFVACCTQSGHYFIFYNSFSLMIFPCQPSSSPRRKSSVPITLFDSLRIRSTC